MVYQILGGLLVIFFIFLLVMCWKTWRVLHILVSFSVFGAAVTFVIFAGLVLRTHAAWRKLYVDFERAAVTTAEKNQQLLYGDLTAVQQKEPSLASERAELNNVTYGRGRILRECSPVAAVSPTTIRVRTVPASAPPDAKPQPSGLMEKQVVYIFSEQELPDSGKVPAAYLGEWTVDKVEEAEVTLTTTLPLDPDQLDKIQKAGQGTTWSLYELVPLDGSELFTVVDPKDNVRVGMDKEELAKYLPNQFNWPQDKYDKFLDNYRRVNRPADENDPPENVWLEVKFLKAHKIPVDSDAEQPAVDAGYFDASGRAVVRSVRRGQEGNVEFKDKDVASFDRVTAETLIAEGICEKIRPVFHRQLHDYKYFFHQAYHRHIQLDDALRRAKRDADEMIDLARRARETEASHQTEKVKLQEELARFQAERAEATNYLKALAGAWDAQRQRLSQLHKSNYQLMQELVRLQVRMAAEINQRTLQATAQTPSTPEP